MKIAVISDIHGNSAALRAVYQKLEEMSVDGIIYLGDYLTGFPEPQRVLELIEEKKKTTPSYFIRGNWDDMMIGRPDDYRESWNQNIWMGVALYAMEKITDGQLAFLSSMPSFACFQPEGCPEIACCHGSPANVGESLAPDTDEARAYLEQIPGTILLCGHTHNQFCCSWQGKTLLNPGSVGLPGLGSTKARFAVIEPAENGWQHTFFAVDYDLQALKQELLESDMEKTALLRVPVMAESIDAGEDYMVKSVPFATAAAKKDGILGGPAAIDKAHWLLGLKEVGMREDILRTF